MDIDSEVEPARPAAKVKTSADLKKWGSKGGEAKQNNKKARREQLRLARKKMKIQPKENK